MSGLLSKLTLTREVKDDLLTFVAGRTILRKTPLGRSTSSRASTPTRTPMLFLYTLAEHASSTTPEVLTLDLSATTAARFPTTVRTEPISQSTDS